jgi:hypothetical protein
MEREGDAESVDSSVKSADINDVFGLEDGGFCKFTNSIVIVHLRLWLNEKLGLTSFVSRELPQEIQVDSMRATSSTVAAWQQSTTSSESKL